MLFDTHAPAANVAQKRRRFGIHDEVMIHFVTGGALSGTQMTRTSRPTTTQPMCYVSDKLYSGV